MLRKEHKETKWNKLVSSKLFTVSFILLLIAGVVTLAFTVLLKQSLRLDEAQSLWQSSHSVTGILKIIAQDVHVPLYHYIVHFWMLYFGNDIATTRIISLVFFAISIPAMYWLGKTSFNQKIALFSTLLYAISPFMNWYGSELRMYTMLSLFTILNQMFFIRIIKHNKNYDWYGYAFTALFGIFTHYFFFFNLITQVIFYLSYKGIFKKKSFYKFLITAVFLFIAFLPWIINVLKFGGSSNSQPLLIKPSSIDFFNTYSRFIFGFQEDSLNSVILSVWPITILLGFLGLKKSKKFDPIVVYFLMAAILPILIAFLVSITVRPLFVTRYLIVCLPSLYILISLFLSLYTKKISVIMHTLIFLVMLSTLVVQLVNVNTPVKEDYKDVALYLNEKASSKDVIITSAPFTIYPVEYYYKGDASLYTLPIWNREETGSIPPFSPEEMVSDVEQIKSLHQNVWVILSYDQGYEKDIKNYFDNHFEKLEEKSFSPGLHLYEYKLRYDQDYLVSTVN